MDLRSHGCGHGECTTASTPCRYETPSRAARWSPADLDRCQHGRHSADHCFDCPGGHSVGNPFLLTVHSADGSVRLDGGGQSEIRVRQVEGRLEVRIGTMVRGEPIWVVVRNNPREASVAEEEYKLPCSACGHRVRPGRHSLEQCAENQRADAAGDDPADIDEEQNDGE